MKKLSAQLHKTMKTVLKHARLRCDWYGEMMHVIANLMRTKLFSASSVLNNHGIHRYLHRADCVKCVRLMTSLLITNLIAIFVISQTEQIILIALNVL